MIQLKCNCVDINILDYDYNLFIDLIPCKFKYKFKIPTTQFC